MAQTPISASVLYNSTTPTTIYTVPAGKTAVVKGVLATSLTTSFDTVTLNKVSGGTNYPLVVGQVSGYITQSSTYYLVNGVKTINLLQTPITLAAGDSISISSSGTSYYRTENATTATTYKIFQFAYLNGNYIAVGQDTVTGYGLILTSTNGTTYTQQPFTASVTLTNITYGNGYYVVCNSTGGTIHYSTNLTSWTQVSLPTTFACQAITYGGGKFVTGGVSGRSYYATTTPLSWTEATVFNTNSIYSLAYIGTNYFYGVNGTSYYTSDFSTYTQPFTPLATGQTNEAFAPTNNAVLATNRNIASSNPNTFLRVSTTGASWTNVTTVANNQVSYYSVPKYFSNGAYITYRSYNPSTNYYLYSADGVTWAEGTYGSLSIANSSGGVNLSPAYYPTANATYANKLLYNGYAGSAWNAGMSNISASGSSLSNLWTNNLPNFANSTYNSDFQALIAVGNPFDGSWVMIGNYASGGNNIGPYYYGNTGSLVSGAAGFVNSGFGTGYMFTLGCLPNSPVYLGGCSGGWVMRKASSSGGWSYYITNPAYGYGNPSGIDWNLIGGNSVVGMARGGEASTSPFVIAWANGTTAVTTNQGTTWTMGNIGLISGEYYYQANNDRGCASQIQYGNGYFWFYSVASSLGQIAYSADGINWTTMPSGVESIYSVNSQNVFITASGIATSATGVVDSFTAKGSTSFSGYPTTNRLAYVGSNYFLYYNGALYQSSDLITWTNKTFTTTNANNESYWSTNTGAIAYSGTGTAIGISYASQSAVVGGTVGKTFTPSNSIYIGNATASIVQID